MTDMFNEVQKKYLRYRLEELIGKKDEVQRVVEMFNEFVEKEINQCSAFEMLAEKYVAKKEAETKQRGEKSV